jgi:DNA-binding transcriptional regulator YdaS (Cro superfamily)
MIRVVSDEQLRERIRDRIAEVGSQGAWARHLGVSDVYVSHVMSGRRRASAKVLADIGLERIEVVVKQKEDQCVRQN